MKEKRDIYQEITDKLIAQLEAGTPVWRKSWQALDKSGMPKNLTSGKYYRGINFLMLACSPYSDNRWMTYKQAAAIDAQVRVGEKGTSIVFWNWLDTGEKLASGKPKLRPFLKTFTVFNAEQIDGLPEIITPNAGEFDPIERAEQVITETGADIRHSGSQPCYSPIADRIMMPEKTTFDSPQAYYATAYHELAHWSGHASRLNREGVTDGARFGSEKYGKEELIAEMAAAFLCAETGIDGQLESNASYLKSWINALKADNKLALQAAGAAQKAADLILKREFEAA